MLGVTIRSVCLLGTIPIFVYLFFYALNNEYQTNNRVIIEAQEPLSDFLYHTIKELFRSYKGYTAAFWAKKIGTLPSIHTTHILRKPEKTWVVYLEQVEPKAMINGKFVFCNQGLLDENYFTDEQLKNCPHITTTIDYTYEQLCTFLPSILSVAHTYLQNPSIHIDSPYNCFLTMNGITVQFAKSSIPVDWTIIEKAIERQSEIHAKKLIYIADIRFKNQIILHRPKVVPS